jgi:hypothetical protein
MIVLTETTDNLEIVLGGSVTTNQLPVLASWRDITTTAYTAGRTQSATNNTTDVVIVASPASSTQRVVDYISVYNNDTATQTVTIKFDANGTERILFKGVITAGARLEYTDKNGFSAYNPDGSLKTSNSFASPVSEEYNIVVLASDVVNDNAVANTLQDCTGLSFNVTAGNFYKFKFHVMYSAAATATGSRWTIEGPAFSYLTYMSEYSLAATTTTRNANVVSYQLPAASNATSANVTSNQAVVEGLVKASANGTIQLQFASEVADSAITAIAGSFLEWVQLA